MEPQGGYKGVPIQGFLSRQPPPGSHLGPRPSPPDGPGPQHDASSGRRTDGVDKTISQDETKPKVLRRPRHGWPRVPTIPSITPPSQREESGTETGSDVESDTDSDEATLSLKDEIRARRILLRVFKSRTGNQEDYELQDVYGTSKSSPLIDRLMKIVMKSRLENDVLRDRLKKQELSDSSDVERESRADMDAELEPAHIAQPVFESVHCVECAHGPERSAHPPMSMSLFAYFHDIPRTWKGDSIQSHLRGSEGLGSLQAYFASRRGTAFLSAFVYSCAEYRKDQRNVKFVKSRQLGDGPDAIRCGRRVTMSQQLQDAIKTVITTFEDRFPGFVTSPLAALLDGPCLFFYLYGEALARSAREAPIDEWDQNAIILLCEHISDLKKKEWDEARALFGKGRVNAKHFSLLFKPNEPVVVTKGPRRSLIHLGTTKSYPWSQGTPQRWQPHDYSSEDEDNLDDGGGSGNICLPKVGVEFLNFSGSFYKSSYPIQFKNWRTQEERDRWEVDIVQLDAYPLRHASSDLFETLLSRGEKFWRCRKPYFACYMADSENELQINQAERRFMIDYKMYNRLHDSDSRFGPQNHQIRRNILGDEDMAADTPPGDGFAAYLPPEVLGFDMVVKKWRTIRVDYITDVTWNKEAFNRLVIPEATKELVQAVITGHKQPAGPWPDIVEGKGKGLLILLHGSPGTGKTLTAESIAEDNEMPLYRVTCGDIGLEPWAVEQYLNKVLQIGKAWGCVVLLDEADVFVEERSFTDQQRNAVISVFLRVLEYYDGILILTTNRVGTFDDAFKSRIQLALRYPDLDQQQREGIWRNFIRLLRRTEETVDYQDLEMNIPKLAEVNINGRQIRNVITTAKHLARFRKQRLVYGHVRDAIAAVVKFNEYLEEVKGASDEIVAREDKLR